MNKLIKICPMCGCTDLREFNWGQWISAHWKSKMECTNCMHCDTFFPEVDESRVQEFRKRIQK